MPDSGIPKAGLIKARVSKPVAGRQRPQAIPVGAAFPIVALGSSAGGLKACVKLLDAVPDPFGMAFILVQHLDPTHQGLLVKLLAEHTSLAVVEAADGMRIEPEHLYVIPPGVYLSVSGVALRLSSPEIRDGSPHGARLPFDVLLCSLADEYGPRVACVVLSGSGNDGSAGLRAVKAEGGFVIVQDPAEADYDGMPRSAIATGDVDIVAPAGAIPKALLTLITIPGKGTGLKKGKAKATKVPAMKSAARAEAAGTRPAIPDMMSDIIELLRQRKRHDFTPYKRGTLERRIERRVAQASLGKDGLGDYLDLLRGNPGELDLLAKDLLINVTSFFRDPVAFASLAKTVIPALLQRAPEVGSQERLLRVWVAGCSTGEEAYSIVMLFHEAFAAHEKDLEPGAERRIALQVFASDLAADAVAFAREGLYPPTIATDVSPERLARFFSKEDGHGYRILPELRRKVVFTVQDLLSDPPFSRLDLVSCRNLMIYLRSEAQAKAVALFHFALREGGFLLLGSAETVSEADGRFRMVQKSARLYRHVGPKRPGDLSFADAAPGLSGPRLARTDRAPGLSRPASLAELCRQTVLDMHAPAAVLCDARHECLYLLGPTDSYLRIPPGQVTTDLVVMARVAVRARLRAALIEAAQTGTRVTTHGGRIKRDGHKVAFTVDVQPLEFEGEPLLLVCFLEVSGQERPDGPGQGLARDGAGPPTPRDASRIAELERDMEALRSELDATHRVLDASAEDQRAVNEEALSVNEEFQSTNEELLTSKEELQSLNEELTALNSQLQETLDRQRITADDLQNILYSTDVATLFLSRDMDIRFFTPAMRALFNLIPGDVGRPLSDLHALAVDTLLPADAQAVLHDLQPFEREIETPDGRWLRRRILPYRSSGALGGAHGGVEGVVITFNDITRRKQEAAVVEAAKQAAEAATLAKSRFLAAASHDLRQPLQTLALLQGMLTQTVTGTKVSDNAPRLMLRMDQTLDVMVGMLDTLLDINQIDAGVVRVELSDVHLDGLLSQLRDEFTCHAEASGLQLRVMPCSATIRTDPRLLAQMLRNLISNALKYTRTGRVLVGCRRHGTGEGGTLSIEVLDTGIGIPATELSAIFDEFHQIGNEARERSRGLGLGLSIVRRLGKLLGHPVRVKSSVGKGSDFTVVTPRVVDRAPPGTPSGVPPGTPSGTPPGTPSGASSGAQLAGAVTRTGDDSGPKSKTGKGAEAAAPGISPEVGTIWLIEDDPDLLDLLQTLLQDEGWRVKAAVDGPAAIAALKSEVQGSPPPCLLLCDFNLPGGMNGLQTVAALRDAIQVNSSSALPATTVPAIILTGDISSATLQAIAKLGCLHISKPVTPQGLFVAIERLIAQAPAPATKVPDHHAAGTQTIFVVDDDADIRLAMRDVLEAGGYLVEDYAGGEAFLAGYGTGRPGQDACLLVDAAMPGMDGLELVRRVSAAGYELPAIVITGHGDVPMAVQAMKNGALDFIEKPVRFPDLLASIEHALYHSRYAEARSALHTAAAGSIAGLTPRQRRIMVMVLDGQPSKNIAADLGISQRTVENHRAAIMHKTGTRSLPALARLALAAEG